MSLEFLFTVSVTVQDTGGKPLDEIAMQLCEMLEASMLLEGREATCLYVGVGGWQC